MKSETSKKYTDEDAPFECFALEEKVDKETPPISLVENQALVALKAEGKWAHLFQFGKPQRPYPTNFENDLTHVMLGIYESKRIDYGELEKVALRALSFLADLNGSEWIKGDGVGEKDMRQRAKALQQELFDKTRK